MDAAVRIGGVGMGSAEEAFHTDIGKRESGMRRCRRTSNLATMQPVFKQCGDRPKSVFASFNVTTNRSRIDFPGTT